MMKPLHVPSRLRDKCPVIQFVTVCAKNRQPVLANEKVHLVLRNLWSKGLHWQVGAYVIMPDHLHLFCSPRCYPPEALSPWIAWWKRMATRHCSDIINESLWQANFWDRQLRSGDSYAEKWNYVRMNPVRAGLVSLPEDWPYYGILNHLEW